MSQEPVVSLPSIREMFPEHLLKEDRGASSTARRRDSRYSSQSPQLAYLSRPQEPSRRTGALPPSARSPYLSASSPHLRPTSSSSTLSHPHSSPLAQHSPIAHQSHPRHAPPQGQQGQFSVLRSDPSSTSLKHVVSSNTLPGRGAIPSATATSSHSAGNGNASTVSGAGGSPIFRVSLPPSSSTCERRSSAIPQHPHPPHPHRSHPDLRSVGVKGPGDGDISMSYSIPPPSHPRRHSASGAPSHSASGSSHPAGPSTYPAIISFPVSSSSRAAQSQEFTEDQGSDDECPSDGNGKKHVCPTCFKRFNRPSSLRIHVNTHTGATPFRCPWPNCGREFNVNSNMRRHYRNHTTPGLTRTQVTDTRRRRRRTSATSPPAQNPSPSVPPPSHTAQQHMMQPRRDQYAEYMPSPPISSFSISEESDDDDMSPAPFKEEDELYDAPSSFHHGGRRSSESLSLTRGVAQINVSQVRGKRASTPGSSFHSSSPSPSPSPGPQERQWRGGRERRYSASKPYARAVSSQVSTALRPVAYERGDEKMVDVW